jgi:hypothetical protein
LDVHVADAIFSDLIIENLIKKHKKSVIFVTSHYKYLDKNPELSEIFLVEGGMVFSDKEKIDKYL